MPAFPCITGLKAATDYNYPEWLPQGHTLSNDAESHHSDGTRESQQVVLNYTGSREVTSRASPEVLGAVDLLSLKLASWTRPSHLMSGECPGSLTTGDCPAKVCTPERFRKLSDSTCCILPAEAPATWVRPAPEARSASRASQPVDSTDLLLQLQPAETTSSSTGSRACSAEENQLPALCHQPPAGLRHCQHGRRCCVEAKRLNKNRAGPQQTSRSRGRDLACIKEWAALTTWLRMNLHQARTAKRQVCFVGHMSPKLRRWVFDLNPRLPWDEVSRETKQRLRGLPNEAEQAFARKYPLRDPTGWRDKAVKYKPGNCTDAYNILMRDLVQDLHSLYLQYEVHSRRCSKF